MVWILVRAIGAGSSIGAWVGLFASPAWQNGLVLSLWTGLASTFLAYALSAWIISILFVRDDFQVLFQRFSQQLSTMLAIPHAAFAIGLVFLLSPSGWILRLLSPWLTGFDLPPPWQSTQDPYGLGLILALVAKETPFMLWSAATQLNRDDVQKRLRLEFNVAQTLGYSPRTAFQHAIWPQISRRLRWPLLAVLAYGLTVVDMAIIIGPASPPTLTVLAWEWLQAVDPLTNGMGAAAALLLAVCLLVLAGLLGTVWLWQDTSKTLALRRVDGHRGTSNTYFVSFSSWVLQGSAGALLLLYAGVILALIVGSVSGVWSFPDVLPQSYTLGAWSNVWGSSKAIWTTLSLALASASLVMLWCVAWLELAPARWDAALRRLLYLPLLIPSVLWVIGLHGMSLDAGLDATWPGVLLAHALAILPYVMIALSPAYMGFDPRYMYVNASMGRTHWQFLTRVKWPLLRASLASGFAVGFAVSVAQYLPTMFVGAGRFATVTTEAVTQASGGQRSITAAYAWLQFSLPVLCFLVAAWLGGARKFKVESVRRTNMNESVVV